MFEPRIPLVIAERVVDFDAHNEHIVQRREYVERICRPLVKRIALNVADIGIAPITTLRLLEERLDVALARTVSFGFREARREIEQLRHDQGVPTLAAYEVPDAGRYAEIARSGLAAIRELVRYRARRTTEAIAVAAREAQSNDPDETIRRLAIAEAAAKTLHNNVLELIGETLNLGRTAGALSMKNPPEFALRSEQLDKNTCDPCSRLHGEIEQLGTTAYFQLMPPTGCLGGGRCRGIWVYGDQHRQLTLGET